MRRLLPGLFLGLACATPSPGCSKSVLPPGQKKALPYNEIVARNIEVGGASRRYAVYLPPVARQGKPLPLFLYLHGQSGTAKGDLPAYTDVAKENGFIILSGLGDGRLDYCGSGWNVGDTTGTCTREAWSRFGANATCCYDSCKEIGMCSEGGGGEAHNCRWSTCLDDVQFLKTLVQTIEAELCIDTSARFLSGTSNGGMMVHHLAANMPTAFAAVLPIYGSPLQGLLNVPAGLAGTSILQIHDRWDTIIPVLGGKSAQGWYYTPLDTVLNAWVTVGGGDPTAAVVNVTTPYSGGVRRLECFELGVGTNASLVTGRQRRVMKCLFDGYHGDWLPAEHGEELTWWFMKQFIQ